MSFSMRGRFSVFCLKCAVFTAFLGSVQVAQAGFEWIPPVEEEPAPVAAPEPSMPPAAPPVSVQKMPEQAVGSPVDAMLPLPGEPETMQVKVMDAPEDSPMPENSVIKHRVVMSGDSPESAMDKAQNEGEIMTIHPFPEDQSSMSEDEMNEAKLQPLDQEEENMDAPEMPAAEKPTENVVVGFGKDMPLALALQQVVPAHYSYSFATSVNPGQRVSWQGGKLWIDVVKDMVKPLDLTVDVHEKVVHVRPEQLSNVVEALPAMPELVADAHTTSRKRQSIKDPGEQAASQSPQVLNVFEKCIRAARTRHERADETDCPGAREDSRASEQCFLVGQERR